MNSTSYPTLAEQVFSRNPSLARNAMLAIGGSLLLWASAKLQVPFYPVPMTMQTFVVLIIGTAYGWRLGAVTVALYLAEGALGLPVFAGTPEKGIGLAYMVGPTGGYLVGYVVAAAACGWLASLGWGRKVSTTILSMLAGNALIYAFGLVWLGAVVGWDKPVLAWGLTPFLLGDLLKLVLAAAVLPMAWKAARRSASPKI
jgi:biotin transport system substrate-specific component